MKIAVVGSSGSIGKRYCACLEYLGNEVIKIDLPRPDFVKSFDRVIVATPTNSHFDITTEFLKYKVPILLEKPVSKYLREISCLSDLDLLGLIRVVCNWKFVPGMRESNNLISYDFYHTGSDGTYWDLCQIVYLSNGTCKIGTKSPIFKCSVNSSTITLIDIEKSYLSMLECWLTDSYKMWTLHEGFEMTQQVLEVLEANKKPKPI